MPGGEANMQVHYATIREEASTSNLKKVGDAAKALKIVMEVNPSDKLIPYLGGPTLAANPEMPRGTTQKKPGNPRCLA